MPNDQLVVIGQLKAVISALRSDKKMSATDYSRLNEQLDVLLVESVSTHPSLETLVQKADQTLSNIDLTPLRILVGEQHKVVIRERRRAAIVAEANEFDISDLYPGFDAIPLNTPTWRQKTLQFQVVVDRLKDNPTVDELVEISENLFLHNKRWAPLEQYPHLQGAPIRSLLADHMAKIDQLEALGDSFKEISNCIQLDLAELNDVRAPAIEPGIYGDSVYSVLRHRAEEGLPENLQPSLVMWKGMQRFELLSLWFNNGPLSEIKSILLLAISGFDPRTQAAGFHTWLSRRRQRETNQYQEFQKAINAEKLSYWVSWVFSSREVLEDDLERIWLPVIQSMGREKQKEHFSEVQNSNLLDSEQAGESVDANPPIEQAKEIEVNIEAPGAQSKVDGRPEFIPEDSADSLTAPVYKQSQEDEYVARTSTWSAYLRPFLQENWLAVIGMGFLLAALFLLSGFTGTRAYLSEIVLVIVLAFFGISFAKISMFVYRREETGASRRATELFALTCIYTLPFSFIMVLQIWTAYDGWISGAVAGGLAIGYMVGLFPRLLKWISGPFELKVLQPLLYGNLVLLLPILPTGSDTWNNFLPHLIPFMGLIALVTGLKLASGGNGTSQRFYFSAYSGQLLLLVIISLAFFRFLPGLGEVGLFIALVAAGVTYLTESNSNKSVFTGAVLLMANLLAVYEPAFLAGTLLLSIVTWWVIAKPLKETWVYEWIVFHVFALVITMHYLVTNEIFSQMLFVTLAVTLASGILFELVLRRREFGGRLKLVSLLAFVYPLLPLVYAIAGVATPLWMLVLSLPALGYNYLRFGLKETRWFWLASVLVAALVPLLWIPQYGYLYLGIFSLLWALSPRIHQSPLPELTSSILWVLLIAPLPFLFTGVLSQALEAPDWTIYIGAGFHIAASAVASRRTQSSIPIYLALGLFALIGKMIATELGFHPRSGMTTGSLAAGLALLAFYLQKNAFWQQHNVAETIFGRSFKLKNFLALPVFHASWITLVLSIYSIANGIYTTGFYPLLALSITINLAAMLTIGFLGPYRIIGYLVPLPILTLGAYLMILLPAGINWIAGIALLTGFHFLLDQKVMENTLVRYVLTRQLRFYANILVAVLPVVAFLGWPQLISNELQLATYVLVTVVFIHFFCIPRYPTYGAGMTLFHIVGLAGLGMLNFDPVGFLPWLIPNLVAVLLAIRFIATTAAGRAKEVAPSDTPARAYLIVIPWFLIAASVSISLMFILQYAFGFEVFWWPVFVGLFAVHICWYRSLSVIPKLIVSIILALMFFDDPILLIPSSLCIYVLSEYLNIYLRNTLTPAFFPAGQPLLILFLLVAGVLLQVSGFSTFVDNTTAIWTPLSQFFVLLAASSTIAFVVNMSRIESSNQWFSRLADGLIYSILPIGFFGYFLMQQALGPDALIAVAIFFAIVSMMLIHLFFVSKKSVHYAHLLFAHLIAPWLLFSSGRTALTTTDLSVLPMVLLGAFSILFTVSYTLENNIAFNYYRRPVLPWLVTTATAFLIAVLLYFPAPFESYFGYLILPVIHLGFRRFNNQVAYAIKLVASMLTGFAIFGHLLTSMVAGAFIFSGWELLTTGLDRLKRLRFRGDVSGEFDFTRTLQWCLFGTIAIHLFSNILSPMEHQNILLYALIPLFYFLHLRRDQQYLSFAVLAAFVYANGFMFYGMIDFFSTYSLTGLHLTSLSFIFSIAVFAGFRRAMQ